MAGPIISIEVLANIKNAFNGVNDFVNGAKSSLTKLADFTDGIGKKIAAAFAVGTLIKLGKDSLDTAEAVGKLAKQLNMTVEGYSSLEAAAKRSQVSNDDFTRSMNAISRSAFQAASGAGESVMAWTQLGVKVTDSSGRMKGLEALLADVSNGFQAMPDGITKSAIAMKLFGEESGAKLLPFVNQGADGLQRLREEATAAGNVISGEFSQAATETNQNLRSVSGLLPMVAKQLTSELAPALSALSGQLRDFLTNQAGGLVEFLKTVSSLLAPVFEGAIRAGEGLDQIFLLLGGRMAMFTAQLKGDNTRAVEIYNNTLRESIRLSDQADERINKLRGNKSGGEAPVTPPTLPAPAVDITGFKTFLDTLHGEWEKVNLTELEQIDIWEAHQKEALARVGQPNTALFEIAWGEIEQTAQAKRTEINQQRLAETRTQMAEMGKAYEDGLKKQADIQRKIDEGAFLYDPTKGYNVIGDRIRRLEGDDLTPSKEKNAQLVDLYGQQAAALDRQISAKTKLRAASGDDPELQVQLQAELFNLDTARLDALQKIRDLQMEGTFFGRMHSNIAALAHEWGNMATKMADVISGTVTGAVQGLSSAMANVIMGTQSAAQAFGQFALSMATSFIASVIQMILMATIAIPILTALGILSGGATASAGVAVVGASLAAVPSMTAGFADGGVIRQGTGPRADDVLIRASRGEYIMPAASVQFYGQDFMEALRRRMIAARDIAEMIPRGISRPISRGAYADGGTVEAGLSGGGQTTNVTVPIAIVKNRQEMVEFTQKHGIPMMVDYLRKNPHTIGMRA